MPTYKPAAIRGACMTHTHFYIYIYIYIYILYVDIALACWSCWRSLSSLCLTKKADECTLLSLHGHYGSANIQPAAIRGAYITHTHLYIYIYIYKLYIDAALACWSCWHNLSSLCLAKKADECTLQSAHQCRWTKVSLRPALMSRVVANILALQRHHCCTHVIHIYIYIYVSIYWAIPYYTIPCYATLHYTTLRYATLRYATLRYTSLHYTMLHEY